MAIKLLFEDKEDTPSSILLKKSMYGENIYFSGGCHQIIRQIKILKSDEKDIIYVFYDVSPNNEFTVKYYKNLVYEVKADIGLRKSVHVVPIVCIEYYLCKFLYKYGYLYTKNNKVQILIDKLVNEFKYEDVAQDIIKGVGASDSLEKIYKYIIKNLGLQCLHNSLEYESDGKNRKANSLRGIFYIRDCICDRKYCRIDSTDSLQFKAERFYTSLPVFVVVSKEHEYKLSEYGISIDSIDNNELQKKIQDMYNMICASMNLNTIHISM